jgi:hypothetical protein
MIDELMELHAGPFDQEAVLVVDDPVKLEPGKPRGSLGRISLSDWAATALAESASALNIAGVHQDAVTREWARQVADQVIQLLGERSVRTTWCKIRGLSDPEVFRDAVQAATTADILIVSVRAAADLPLDFYEWVETWLPLRLQLAGTLVALIGAPEQPGADSFRIGHYLQDVAQRGQLEFLLQEQKPPVELPESSMEKIAERASATTYVFSDRIVPRHWGISE